MNCNRLVCWIGETEDCKEVIICREENREEVAKEYFEDRNPEHYDEVIVEEHIMFEITSSIVPAHYGRRIK